MLRKLRKALFHPGLAAQALKERALWERYYWRVPAPKLRGSVPYDGPDGAVDAEIIAGLEQAGYEMVPFRIDGQDYRRYLTEACYEAYPYYYGGGRSANFVEKSLEHYLAAKLLELMPGEIYIDIANAGSPAPEIYYNLFGCKQYRQDLCFPPGLHGNVIGGDAGSLPLPDGYVNKMALHCSFEHFECDSDMCFIREAGRVLAPLGKLLIVPLYLFNRYAIQTDPVTWPKGGLPLEVDAVVYCARGYGNRHGRFYDVSHLSSRIRGHLGPLRLTLYLVENAKEIHSSCYVRFAALFERP